MKPQTIKDFQSKGGKNRWKGKSKKERSEIMKRVRAKGKQKVIPS